MHENASLSDQLKKLEEWHCPLLIPLPLSARGTCVHFVLHTF